MTARQRANTRRRLEEDIHAAIVNGISVEVAKLMASGTQETRARVLACAREDLANRITIELKRHFSIIRRKA